MEGQAAVKSARREVMPLSSRGAGLSRLARAAQPSGASILPNETVTIKSIVSDGYSPFHAERLFVGGPAKDEWLINDIRIDGRSQFELPVASFRCTGDGGYALAITDCFKEFEIVVTYVGAKPEGEHFFASVVGVVPPGH